MSNYKSEHSRIQDEPSLPQQALQWAKSHPGVLLLNSLALVILLAWHREIHSQTITGLRVGTEADIVDRGEPLFI
jgi:hypothetical protein